MSEKIKVGILGATGMVGQRFVTLLENHPWFELVTLAASAHSAGKTYEEAIGSRWKMETPMPEFVKHMVVKNVADVEDVVKDVDFVFSAVNMPKDEIRAIEEEYAKTETPVVSNNSAHRFTPDVPMVVPEINADHIDIIPAQRKRLGTKRGFVAVKSNCSLPRPVGLPRHGHARGGRRQLFAAAWGHPHRDESEHHWRGRERAGTHARPKRRFHGHGLQGAAGIAAGTGKVSSHPCRKRRPRRSAEGSRPPPYILNLIGGEDVGADSISARESCRCHKQARANNVRPHKTSIHIIQ